MHAIDVTLGVKAVASPACKIGGGVERGGIAERRQCESSRGNFETKSLSRTGIIFSVFLRLGGGEILYYLFILGSVHMEPSQPASGENLFACSYGKHCPNKDVFVCQGYYRSFNIIQFNGNIFRVAVLLFMNIKPKLECTSLEVLPLNLPKMMM